MMRAFGLAILASGLASTMAATLSGVVLNNKTRQPVTGAEVELIPKSSNAVPVGTLSGRGGRFSFRDVAPGEYALKAKSRAFCAFRVRPQSHIMVRAGEPAPEVTLELAPTASISGRVFYAEEDAPPVGISVSAILYGNLYGNDESTSTWEAVTDSRGEYRIPDLVPGEFYVVARAPAAFEEATEGLRRQPEADEQGRPLPPTDFPAMWYPNTPYKSQAAAVGVAEGDERGGIDFVLRRAPLVTLRGRLVSGVSGRPIHTASLAFSAEGESGFLGRRPSLKVANNEDGTFEVPEVAAGSYRLTAEAREGSESLVIDEPVEVGSSDQTLVVVLKAGDDTKATVRVEGNSPLPDGARIRLGSASIEIARNGSFSFRRDPGSNLPMWLEVRGLYLESATINGERVAPVRLKYPPNCPCTLELTAGADGGSVTARIEIPKGVPAGVVRVADFFLDGAPPWSARIFETEEEELTLRDLPPGRHRLVAWSGLAPCNLQEPTSCSAAGRVVEVAAGGNVEAALTVEAAGRR